MTSSFQEQEQQQQQQQTQSRVLTSDGELAILGEFVDRVLQSKSSSSSSSTSSTTGFRHHQQQQQQPPRMTSEAPVVYNIPNTTKQPATKATALKKASSSSRLVDDKTALDMLDNYTHKLRNVLKTWPPSKHSDEIKRAHFDAAASAAIAAAASSAAADQHKIIIKTTRTLPSRVYTTGPCVSVSKETSSKQVRNSKIVYSSCTGLDKPLSPQQSSSSSSSSSSSTHSVQHKTTNKSKSNNNNNNNNIFTSKPKLNYVLKAFDGGDGELTADEMDALVPAASVQQLGKYVTVVNTGLKRSGSGSQLVQLHPVLSDSAASVRAQCESHAPQFLEPIYIDSENYSEGRFSSFLPLRLIERIVILMKTTTKTTTKQMRWRRPLAA